MRSVDADTLKEEIRKVVAEERKEDEKWAAGLRYALTIIDKAQTVESSQGEWLDNDTTSWECSCCGYGVNRWNNTPFCPNCGANMKGVIERTAQEGHNNMSWNEPSCAQEESEQSNGETFTAIYDHNDGIFDPTYINDEVDCSDLGIYPWGNS